MAVLVSGSSGGIGSAIVRTLRENGLQTCGIDRVAPRSRSCSPDGFVEADVTCPASAAEAYDRSLERVGRVDHLVNCIGLYDCRTLSDFNWDRHSEIMAANLTAPMALALQWLENEPAAGGCVVNIASAAGVTGSRDLSYSVSKSALLGVTRSLARSVADRGLRVFSVSPGLVASPMSDAMPDGRRGQHVAASLHGRPGEPDEVAVIVDFLVRSAPHYMSGTNVPVSSGQVWS